MADLKIVLTVVDKSTGEVTKVRRSLKELASATEAPARGLGNLDVGLRQVAVAAGGLFAALKVVDFGKDAVGMASNLNETINQSRVVFEGAADSILKWSETTDTAIGQSQRQALAAATDFGDLFRTIGLGVDDASNMSRAVVTLASDLASFKDSSPEEALAALRSGLVGEAEPMRRFGVLLNETTVKAQAMKMGFREVDGQLTESQKVQARYALILEQTSRAQGDFARTSDDHANATRRAQAALENIQTELGQRLLPVVAEVTKELADNLPRALEDLGPAFDAAGQAARLFGLALEEAAVSAGGLGSNIDQVLLPPLRALGRLVGHDVQQWDEFRKRIQEGEKPTGALTRALDYLGREFDNIAHKRPDGLAGWIHNFYETERAAMAAERGVNSAWRALRQMERDYAGTQGDLMRIVDDKDAAEAAQAFTDAWAAADEASARARQARADAWKASEDTRKWYEEQAARAASAARTAASEADRAFEEGFRRSAQAASEAVTGLRRALDSVLASPLLGSQRMTRGIEDLQDQIAQSEYRVAQMRRDGTPRSDLRAELKRQAGLRGDLELLELEQRATITPQERQVERALNPLMPELSVDQKIAAALALQGQVAAAESVEASYNTTNHISVNVNMGGGIEVVASTEEGRSVGMQIAEALRALVSAGATKGISASPALAGAR